MPDETWINEGIHEFMSRSVHEHLEDEVGRMEGMIYDFPDDLKGEYRRRSWPHRVLKEWDVREAEYEFQLNRAAIFCGAVGRARLALKNGDLEKAQTILFDACEDVRELLAKTLEEFNIGFGASSD